MAPTIAAAAASASDPPLGTPTPQTELPVRSSSLILSTPTFPNDSKGRSSNPTTSGEASNDTSGSGASVTLALPKNGVPDWTATKPRGVLTEHMVFARNLNWSATPLGSMKTWSAEFREVANLVMRNPHPVALFWGEELTMLYNEAYKNEVARDKHPDLMGTGFSGPFSELWDGWDQSSGNVLERVKVFGKRMTTYQLRVLGFYNAPFETTYQTVSHRRMQTLRQISEKLVEIRSTKHFWQCVLDGLRDSPWEVPFALLYSVTDSDDADTVSHSSDSTISMKSCLLEGAIGIPEGHAASPPKLDLKRSKEGFIPAFCEAMRTREPTILHRRNGSLPDELTAGIEWRGYGEPCRSAIIIPVRPTNSENILAFLLLGVNPRRAYDEEYRAFVHMLNRQLANSLASFVLFEEEVRRNRNAAEVASLQREQLSQQLEVQASRMRRMTELSPLGMYLFGCDGILLEANERYYEMTKHGRDDDSPFAFLKPMSEESVRKGKIMWRQMMEDGIARQEEFHLTGTDFVPRDLAGEPIEYWVLATSQPEIDAHGEMKSIMGSIADISHLKWVQGLQEQRLKEAEEIKRQQNEFIDITSHEMRNPLSAILLCADDIRESLSQHLFGTSDAKVVEECIDAANNIALCNQIHGGVRKTVHLGADTEQPHPHFKGFEYIPTRSSIVDIAAGQDWGDGERLYIRVKVEDTGVGLAADEKHLLFQRFAQASPRTHATYGGSGLGLFISRQLAELHGGQVGVSSEAGIGSTFGFFVQGKRAPVPKRPGILGPAPLGGPQETAGAHASVRSNSSPASIPSTIQSGLSTDHSDLAILIVEDNLVNQRVLSKQLKKAGCAVYTADNGLLALEFLAKTSFQDPAGQPLSIILMDLEMPEMDGLTAVGRIRDMEVEGVVTGHVPVIAVTANVRDEQTRAAMKSGMDDVVAKPFRVHELLAKVRSVLARLGSG
ncbi:hypothetical protein PMIN07_000109 [Paraphaeosphaeria minitans]